jgi:hypothetical protein
MSCEPASKARNDVVEIETLGRSASRALVSEPFTPLLPGEHVLPRDTSGMISMPPFTFALMRAKAAVVFLREGCGTPKLSVADGAIHVATFITKHASSACSRASLALVHFGRVNVIVRGAHRAGDRKSFFHSRAKSIGVFKPSLIDLEARSRVTGAKQGLLPVQAERLSERGSALGACDSLVFGYNVIRSEAEERNSKKFLRLLCKYTVGSNKVRTTKLFNGILVIKP